MLPKEKNIHRQFELLIVKIEGQTLDFFYNSDQT